MIQLGPQDMTMLRAWIVLMNIIVGIGMLSLPYCFLSSIITNTIILVFIGTMAFLSFVLLIDTSLAAGFPIDYPRLMSIATTPKIEWIPNFLMFTGYAGCGVLHLQYTYGLVEAILREINDYHYLPDWVYNRWMWICGLSVVVCLPLTFIRTISKFSRVSMFTFVLIITFLFHAAFYLGKAIVDHQFDPNGKIEWLSFNDYFLTAVAIESFAFHCHPTVGPTLQRLIDPTRKRQYIVMGSLTIGAFLTYYLGGLLPYLTLVDKIKDPLIFSCYPDGQVFTIVMKGLYGMFLLVTTPLLLFSGRIYLAPLICQKAEPGWKWDVMGVVVLALCAVIAVLVVDIEEMFNFSGGVGVPIILYLMPALFYLRICKGQKGWRTWVAWFFIPLGFGTMGASLWHSINLLKPSS